MKILLMSWLLTSVGQSWHMTSPNIREAEEIILLRKYIEGMSVFEPYTTGADKDVHLRG